MWPVLKGSVMWPLTQHLTCHLWHIWLYDLWHSIWLVTFDIASHLSPFAHLTRWPLTQHLTCHLWHNIWLCVFLTPSPQDNWILYYANLLTVVLKSATNITNSNNRSNKAPRSGQEQPKLVNYNTTAFMAPQEMGRSLLAWSRICHKQVKGSMMYPTGSSVNNVITSIFHFSYLFLVY